MRNKEKWREWYIQYRAKNRERLNAGARAWQLANPDRVRGYYHANKEKYAPIYKRWKEANKGHTNAYARERSRIQYQKNPEYKLRLLFRRYAQKLKQPNKRRGTTLRFLGCSVDEARRHIEKQWLPGMSWENHSRSGWHIDHIVPLKAFSLADAEQAKRALHYTNLRPLWAKDNLSKGAKLQAA
jgi:hypothetical protein